jgi:hypothetical protein
MMMGFDGCGGKRMGRSEAWEDDDEDGDER